MTSQHRFRHQQATLRRNFMACKKKNLDSYTLQNFCLKKMTQKYIYFSKVLRSLVKKLLILVKHTVPLWLMYFQNLDYNKLFITFVNKCCLIHLTKAVAKSLQAGRGQALLSLSELCKLGLKPSSPAWERQQQQQQREKRRKLFHHDMMPLCSEEFYRFWALVAHQFSTRASEIIS